MITSFFTIQVEENHKEMQEFYNRLCGHGNILKNTVDASSYINMKGSNDEGVGSEVEVTNSAMEDPDNYDIEMTKAQEEQGYNELFEEESEPTFHIPDPSSFNWTKRKRETVPSLQTPTFDLPGDVNHDGKRRKLDIGTNTSQVSSPRLRKKGRKDQRGKFKPYKPFSRGNTLDSVFQAIEAVKAFEMPQEEGSDAPELDSLETQPSVSQDLRVHIAGSLYPTVGQDDIRIVNAAANFLDIHQGDFDVLELGSTVSELGSTDRKGLKEAFGNSTESQLSGHTEKEPSPFVTFPRTKRFSDRCIINKSLMRCNLYKFKRNGKPIGPSKNFKCFFMARRQRKSLLRKGEASWDIEDASFIQSGQDIAEPSARLGAEFVAKSLLDVSDIASLTLIGTVR